MNIWHPRASRVSPKPYRDGGSYNTGYPWRQVIHTTEGGPNYTPSTASYFGHQAWPHCTIARVGGTARITQHLPIDRAAMAMENRAGGVETNRARAVQVEVGWWAARTPELPDDIAACLADWLTWVSAQTHTTLDGPKFFGPDCGWQLSSVTARQRMSFVGWVDFSGVLGHQHAPENEHWDPGALDLSKVLRGSSTSQQEALLMAAALDDNDARKAIVRDWFWRYLGRGPHSVDEFNLHVFVFGAKGADACLTGIADSTEAEAFRGRRGW